MTGLINLMAAPGGLLRESFGIKCKESISKIESRIVRDGGVTYTPMYALDPIDTVIQKGWSRSDLGRGHIDHKEIFRGLPVFPHPERYYTHNCAYAPDIEFDLNQLATVWDFALAAVYDRFKYGQNDQQREVISTLAGGFADIYRWVGIEAWDGLSTVCVDEICHDYGPCARWLAGKALVLASRVGLITGFMVEKYDYHDAGRWIKVEKMSHGDVCRANGIKTKSMHSIF